MSTAVAFATPTSSRNDISNLKLHYLTENCLRQANIINITDVINYPKEDWPKVKGFGFRELKDLQDSVHRYGITNFSALF